MSRTINISIFRQVLLEYSVFEHVWVELIKIIALSFLYVKYCCVHLIKYDATLPPFYIFPFTYLFSLLHRNFQIVSFERAIFTDSRFSNCLIRL